MISECFGFYLHLYRYLYLYLLKNRLKPRQIMVSGEWLGKDSTLDKRSGLDNFVLMLRPGWMRHQTDFVEARVSKTTESLSDHLVTTERLCGMSVLASDKMAGSRRLSSENDS